MIDNTTRGTTIDLIIDMLTNEALNFTTNELISGMLTSQMDNAVIANEIYNDMIKRVIVKECAFQLQLERDAHSIFSALFDQGLFKQVKGSAY